MKTKDTICYTCLFNIVVDFYKAEARMRLISNMGNSNIELSKQHLSASQIILLLKYIFYRIFITRFYLSYFPKIDIWQVVDITIA